ncbi:hypothetical protein WY02_09980 [Pseudonocardia sp. AL041005-10]|nr:glycosyltransferase family 4 protein [Pseudonocardia sp. AL041005-10]ALE78707.1 hypothetical protein WY02_09980 [Pseudonocardia sp. AL041005-10]
MIPNAVEDPGGPGDVGGRQCTESIGLVAVGRLSEVKDPLMFVAISNAVSALGVRHRAEWVGDGPLRSRVEAEIARTGAPVVLSGHSDAVAEKIRAADVMVLTSRFEGMPLVVLEAMSVGRVVVAPRIGGLPEIVGDGVTGALYDPCADADVVATQIADLLSNSERFDRMGRSARARFLELSDTGRMVDSVREVYADALNGHGVGR